MRQELRRHRLGAQGIGGRGFADPGAVAQWFGAMQAQNRTAVLWALGLRCAGITEEEVERAFSERKVVRTWLLRGTLHVAAAEDVPWMLALLAPRLKRLNERRWQELGLEEDVRARALAIFDEALQGGRQLTREGMFAALEQGGVSPEGQRGYHLLGAAALERLICFGPMQGKTETFVLLDEWAPGEAKLAGEAALAELARRYFRSHGPAKLVDFVWWSGLTKTQARRAIAAAESDLAKQMIAEETYWTAVTAQDGAEDGPTAVLLPAFDEYYLAYRDRTAVLEPQFNKRAVSSNGIFRPVVVMDGQIVGIWKGVRRKHKVRVEVELFRSLSGRETDALAEAAQRYGAFAGLEAETVEGAG